jgi:hypothetical protein
MNQDALSCHLSGVNEKNYIKHSFITADDMPMFVKGVCRIKAYMFRGREKSLAPVGIRTPDCGKVLNG